MKVKPELKLAGYSQWANNCRFCGSFLIVFFQYFTEFWSMDFFQFFTLTVFSKCWNVFCLISEIQLLDCICWMLLGYHLYVNVVLNIYLQIIILGLKYLMCHLSYSLWIMNQGVKVQRMCLVSFLFWIAITASMGIDAAVTSDISLLH